MAMDGVTVVNATITPTVTSRCQRRNDCADAPLAPCSSTYGCDRQATCWIRWAWSRCSRCQEKDRAAGSS